MKKKLKDLVKTYKKTAVVAPEALERMRKVMVAARKASEAVKSGKA